MPLGSHVGLCCQYPPRSRGTRERRRWKAFIGTGAYNQDVAACFTSWLITLGDSGSSGKCVPNPIGSLECRTYAKGESWEVVSCRNELALRQRPIGKPRPQRLCFECIEDGRSLAFLNAPLRTGLSDRSHFQWFRLLGTHFPDEPRLATPGRRLHRRLSVRRRDLSGLERRPDHLPVDPLAYEMTMEAGSQPCLPAPFRNLSEFRLTQELPFTRFWPFPIQAVRKRQHFVVAALGQFLQARNGMTESESQFSLTRVASSQAGAPRTIYLSRI